MNTLQKVFIAVLNMSITASYVAIGIMLIRLLFLRKAPKVFSYVLWSAVLIRLVCPVSFSSVFSLLGPVSSRALQDTGALEYVPHDIGFMQVPAINGISSSLPHATEAASVNPMQIVMAVLSVVWLAGIIVLLLYSAISYLNMRDRVRTATLVRDNVFETDRMRTAFLFGLIRPGIYVPVGVRESDLPYVLAHERMHIQRRDYLIKPVAFLVLIVHWFNPLMWASFALMSRDMEMSCDEGVLANMDSDATSSYSTSLLSLAMRRSGLTTGSPLAFSESNVKARIRNVLTYKKPTFWAIILAVVITVSLIVAFTANPQRQQAASTSYLGYATTALMENKTLYVGDNSKVVALIDAMPWPKGIVRSTVELQTAAAPYGLTVNFDMNDDSSIKVQGAISGDAFYRNSIVLFSLIDNVDVINCKIADKTGKYNGASYGFTYTREAANAAVGKDVREFANSQESLRNLLDAVQKLPVSSDTLKILER